MAPGLLEPEAATIAEPRPSKKLKTASAATFQNDDEEVAIAVPSHPLGIKPAGNAYTASENIKSRCGSFARLPDELLSHILESFDADTLIRLGTTCRALYAFTRLDELWRALFVSSPPTDFMWRGTWRSTYLNISPENVTNIPCHNLFSDVLYRPFQCAHTGLTPFVRNIPRSNEIARLGDLTPDDYAQNWTDKPFILTDPVKDWPVYGTWTPEYLLEKFPDVKFRAEAVDWPTSTYLSYMHNQSDESPLYVFDRAFAEKTGIDTTAAPHSEGASYWSPEAFGSDLFSVLGQHRPDCRWMIMGPKRSGSTFHKDPNATSAWNAVLTGSKYWLMFPSGPGIETPPGVIVSEDQSEITSPLSIAEYLLTFHELARQTPGCKEGICYAGEVLHVPSGWFHLVLNIEDSLALTQNFVPMKKLPDVLGFLRDQRGEVSGFKEEVCDTAYELFVEKLQEEYPDILAEGLAELEKKSKGKRGKWEELTKTGGEEEEAGGFSFGFGGDDDDADIP
ncbi:tRNA wybutosine-synthesis-related protein 4 [Parastagonospora nodorum]|nr:tRNA wybutosine-synthesis-related protein 4 [Parastagonospora nodorum]KAH5052442.1 tRNA wybutosine-synthesis-related protein 4 [Parastagonospora nodorum]KAH5083116.1 tRNA wybutosine-synthesis-related protein 4 [Parastagonospora nodorum]KAH5111690.1 tRNA wybutosine-synthesis-related protein 4 [Parastagonospora nodorum]KAH5231545.1 tRNA wybutosine-synthesis-related protein 4 [Parastagonospora nodorum]